MLDIPVYLRRLRGDDPLTTLARLFLLHARVSESAARQALQPLEISRLAAMGVVTVDAGHVYSSYDITQFEGLYFLSDAFSPEFDAVPADHVTGVNPTSILLAYLTIRTPVERALDLGTGNGVQALLAARHAKHVIATDINPRCLNVTAFNARLNGLDHVECRQGKFLRTGCRRTIRPDRQQSAVRRVAGIAFHFPRRQSVRRRRLRRTCRANAAISARRRLWPSVGELGMRAGRRLDATRRGVGSTAPAATRWR